jgi:dsDNA-specific endonuclease/ATPase MutS2
VAFAIDSEVVVTSLGKTGRVVEAGRGGRYRVRVGGVLMLCREEELAQAAGADRSRKRRHRDLAPARHFRPSDRDAATSAIEDTASPSDSDRRRLGSLDLHGFTVEEALGKVEERIDLALRAGLDRLEIIHGRGSGRIKIAVHRLLAELSAVRHFELSRDNPGVTRVFF